MSQRQITIAIDAMGGENSPYKVLKGTEIFLNENKNTFIKFFGNKKIILDVVAKNKLKLFNFEIFDCQELISDSDNVNTILRSKKNSSLYKALEYAKNNTNTGFVSAGSTAAIMVLSRLHMGMINGIDRPAICSIIPNNGTENNKGLEFLQDGSDLISSSFLNEYFIGFVEPNKITSGDCDIIISDGYTGNIMLKSAEGISNFITSNLRDIFSKSLLNKISYKLIEKDLVKFKNQVNPDVYNGAILIGLNGISVKSHGNANPIAFSSAIKQCFNFIDKDLNQQIIKSIKNL